MSYGLLLLRLVVGGTMFSHGAQKLFGWFGGGGPRGTAGFMGQLGFRAPLVMALSAGLGEAGGLVFAAGFLTPLAALGIAIVMINAITLVTNVHREPAGTAYAVKEEVPPRDRLVPFLAPELAVSLAELDLG